MKLGLFGGAFDPIHRGHVAAARAARAAAGLDRLVLVPTADPPHKAAASAPAWARLVMAELAVLGEDGLYVSPLELTPGRVAYTIDTLELVAAEQPEAELHLVLGSDALVLLPSWRRFREVIARARLVVLTRPGWRLDEAPAELGPLLREGTGAAAKPLVVELEVDLSSTTVREALSRGEPPPAEALSPLVLEYIQKYGLYR